MSLATPDLSSPYAGPRPFSAGDTLFGRDREAQELCDLLISERIVLLHSPSGAGKTSLVQARLIPMLEQREFTVLPTMRVSQEPPGGLADGANRYLLSLLLSLQRHLPDERQFPVGRLAGMSLADLLATLPGQGDGQVLIFDQFEEILTVDPTNVAAKRELFAQVGAALRDRNRWALFSMREDYIAALEPYLRPVPTRLGCTYRLDLLEREAAAQAIAGPARAHGVAFAPGAVERLVNNLRLVRVQHADGSVESLPGQYVEPVQLQVVCLRLWKTWARRYAAGAGAGDTTIGEDDIAAMGDVSKALEDYYGDAVADVQARTDVPERSIRDWFDGQLITARGIRNQVLKGQDHTQGLANSAIADLIDTYLVRAEQRRGLTWFELSHDRLIEPVLASNSAWRDANLQQFQRQAALWEVQRRPETLLMRGKALAAAEEWERQNTPVLNPVERAYLDDCRAMRRRERQVRLFRLTIWGLAALAFVAAIFAVNRWIAAESERQAAELARDEASARQLAAQSTQLPSLEAPRSLLLAVEAVSIPGREPLPEAVSALYNALAAAGGTPLHGHTGAVSIVAFSPDSSLLATAGVDGLAQLWQTADPGAAPVALRGHRDAIRALAFSPDGRLVATASTDGTALVWEVARPGAPLAVLGSHTAALTALAFSPDSATLATGSADGAILLWPTANLAATPTPLRGHEEAITNLAFTPAGERLISTSDDQTVRIWTMGRPEAAPVVLTGHEGEVKVLALCPYQWCGGSFATGASVGGVRLWPTGTSIGADIGAIQSLAFDPSRQRLAVGGTDGTAQVWDLTAPEQEPTPLPGHGSAVIAVAFTPDGQSLVTASADGQLRAWSAANLALPPVALGGHEEAITALAISPDGLRLATGAGDATARLWDLGTLSPVAALRGPTTSLSTVIFSADGGQVIAGDRGGAGTRWDLAGTAQPQPLHKAIGDVALIRYSADARHRITVDDDSTLLFQTLGEPGAPPLTLHQGAERVINAALSPDGAQVAASLELESDGGRVDLWATAGSATPRSLPVDAGLVGALAFSPDGARLATGGFEGLVQIWDTRSPVAAPLRLKAHSSEILALAFSPDATLLASADNAGLVVVWDVATGAVRTPLQGAGGPLEAVAIAPDNRNVAAGGPDTQARAWVWDLARPSLVPQVLSGHTDSVLALAFSPDGAALATADANGLTRLWPMDLATLRAAGCATAGRNLHLDEWRAAFGERPYRKTCPDLPISPSLIDSAATFASLSQIDQALALADQVTAAGFAAEIPARAWGRLCRAGSLAGAPRELRGACDQAISLDPQDGLLYDWRAMASALTGDLGGARDDLARYLDWARATGQDESRRAMREAWAADLAAGRSPYTTDTLQQILAEQP
ncbi:MAG: hypothetical protein HGA45_07455 [Chloroflexales bacterium]|nr:hypothetical protein [Chloroflexales bacterium]